VDAVKLSYYLLEENGTATMAIYIPCFSENEIVIDLVPEGKENLPKNEEVPEVEQFGTEEENSTKPESTPALKLGLTIADLAIAHRLRRRLLSSTWMKIIHKLQPG